MRLLAQPIAHPCTRRTGVCNGTAWKANEGYVPTHASCLSPLKRSLFTEEMRHHTSGPELAIPIGNRNQICAYQIFAELGFAFGLEIAFSCALQIATYSYGNV